MSARLTALPPELLTCVVANVELQSSLFNLARCSQQLYLFTIPHLYRHITIQEEQMGRTRRSEKLVLLLLRRPDLARHVRHFTLQARSRILDISGLFGHFYALEKLEPEECQEHQMPESFELDDAFKAIVSALCLSQKEANFWISKIDNTHSCPREFEYALLLVALFNVEKVVLKVEPGFITHYLERMIQKVACGEMPSDIQPPFQKLTMFVYSQALSQTRNTTFIAPLLKLPAIREILVGFGDTLGDLGWDEVTEQNLIKLDNLIGMDSHSSPVTRLDLVAHGLSRKELSLMLRAPKALKTFSYDLRTPSRLGLTDIRDALEPQKSCLETLGLDRANHEKSWGMWIGDLLGDNRALEPLPSFMIFNNLKVFKIAAPFLEQTENGTGRHNLINIFPPNLETLYLKHFQASLQAVLEALEHLLAVKSPKQIPSLKRLILEETYGIGGTPLKLMEVMWKDTQETAMGRLSRLAAAQGVSLEVTGIDL